MKNVYSTFPKPSSPEYTAADYIDFGVANHQKGEFAKVIEDHDQAIVERLTEKL